MKSRCLRCGKTKTTPGWQCDSCAAEFPGETPREREEAMRFFADQEQRLISIAERLDGAGFWAVAKAVSRAADQVAEIGLAIDRAGLPE